MWYIICNIYKHKTNLTMPFEIKTILLNTIINIRISIASLDQWLTESVVYYTYNKNSGNRFNSTKYII